MWLRLWGRGKEKGGKLLVFPSHKDDEKKPLKSRKQFEGSKQTLIVLWPQGGGQLSYVGLRKVNKLPSQLNIKCVFKIESDKSILKTNEQFD